MTFVNHGRLADALGQIRHPTNGTVQAAEDRRYSGLSSRCRRGSKVSPTPSLPDAQTLLDLLPDAVCVVDADGHFVYVSAAFEALFGHTRAQAIGLPMESLIHPDDVQATRKAAARVMAGRPLPNFRNRYRHLQGHYVHVQWSARWLPQHGVRLAVAHEVGDLRQREEALEFQALHDALTGLPNRTHLMQELANRIECARTSQGAFCVLYLDLDGFKQANDRHGHDIGDRLLCEVSERLRGGLCTGDFIARLGGDEFVILLAECPRIDSARQIATHLQALLADIRIYGEHSGLAASIGIACHPEDGLSPGELLKASDHRMYLDKAGRHR